MRRTVGSLFSAVPRRFWHAALLLLIAWPLVAWAAGAALVAPSEPGHADALVVLAGSSTYKERTREAAQLFKEGRAPRVVLTDDNQLSGWSSEAQRNPLYVERAADELKRQGVPEAKIEIVPEVVASTRDEAVRMREYTQSNGLHSILVVTSAYQVRRARWIFDRVFDGSSVAVSFVGVPPGEQTPRPLTWWLHRQGWRMVAGEYLKLGYYFTHFAAVTVVTAEAAQRPNAPGYKTDHGIYRKPPLPVLPRGGGKFIDPVFGTEIMRATDESDGAAPGLGTYYSHWPTFNLNNTRLLIRKGETGDAIVKTFDPVNFKIGSGREVLPIEYPRDFSLSWESSIWSHTDPDVIYTFGSDRKGGMRAYAYNIANRSFKLVKDFRSVAQGPVFLQQMYMSADDDVFCWLLKRVGEDDPFGYIVYKRSIDKVLYNNPASDYVGGINEVHVDKSGKWLTIHMNQTQPDTSGTRVLNLQTGAIDKVYKNATETPAGHGDLGTGTIVGFDAFGGGITIRRLDHFHTPLRILGFQTAEGKTDWTFDHHGTMLADDESWETIGTYHDPSVKLPDYHLFEDEILQVATDGSQRIRRICHTRSVYDNLTNTTGYWGAPKPTISRDGRFIAFTSNWEKSGRYDLFIVRIDPAPRLTSPLGVQSPTPTLQRQRRVRPS
jgi:uncharacterized SAM-binding protein YcdF (DUF218 family)